MKFHGLSLALGSCVALAAFMLAPAAPRVAPPDTPSYDTSVAARSDDAGRRPFAYRPSVATVDLPRGASSGDWHALGPFGGDVTDVAESPTASGVVLAGIAPGGSSGGTLYRSTDNGQNWLSVPTLAFHSVFDIEFQPSGVAFAATDSGVWSSTDDGATWTQHDLGIGANQQVDDVALDHNNAAIVWATVGDGLGSQPVNLVRSSDGGLTWNNVTPPHPAPMSGTAVVVDPADSLTVVALFAGFGGGSEAWITTDGGATWTDRSDGLPDNPLRAAAFAGSRLLVGGGQLFGSQYVGIYASDDLGQTWTRLDDANWTLPVVTAIAVDPNNPQIILCSIDGAGINRSSDGGATWGVQVGGSGILSAQSIRFAPGNSSELWVGATSLGVYHSDDGGDNFAASSTGIGELGLYSIDTSPTDAEQIAVAFQGNNNGGVLTSSDGAVTWTAESAPPTRYSSVRFAEDGTLYALSSGPSSIAPEGLYRRNGDGSWTSLGPDQGPHFESDLSAIRLSATDPDLILLGGSDFGGAGFESTIWRSADAGATWVKQFEGEDGDKVIDIEYVPGSADQNVIATYDGFNDPQQGGALKSSDNGQTWTSALSGLPAFARIPHVCSSAANPGTVFLSIWESFSVGAVYATTDNGTSWTPTGWHGSTINDLVCDQDDADILFVAQNGANRVAKSSDQAASFNSYADGLDTAGTPTELALSRSGTPLLYLSSPHGAYVTPRKGSADDTIFANGFDGS